jgi:hypothetical protein
VGLDGQQARAAEDAFFDDLPKKDVTKQQWEHENLRKKTELANFRRYVLFQNELHHWSHRKYLVVCMHSLIL